jgi:hypothetical protein
METSWHVIGASVQGTSHRKTEIPCQDACSYRVLPTGVLVVAVADGAGTAERSDEGAQCAVEAVIASAEAAIAESPPQDDAAWELLLQEGFRQARRTIAGLTDVEQASLRAFATTLTCAVVSADWLAVGQIGDGLAVARGEDGRLFSACEPQRGEYAGDTFFLTMEEALQQFEVRVYAQSIGALALMTDGLIRLAVNVPDSEPHLPFFQPLFAYTEQIEDETEAQEQLVNLLGSERVNKRTDDDKTLVLAARPQVPDTKVVPDEDVDV